MTLATVAVFIAAACGGSNGTSSGQMASSDKQILRVNDGTEPNSYDPTQETYSYEAAVGRQVFEPLMNPKADLSDVQPAAAQSYSVSSDGMTYTFHLRQNAKWSDGKAVTASDWVYGYKHLLNPALAAGYVDPFFDGTIKGADGYGSVDVTSASAIDTFLNGLGLSAPDPNTFVITLQHPAAYFKWVVSLWVAVPLRQDIVEQAAGGTFPSTDTTKPEAWANNPQTIVGNGPFKISEIVAKDHTTLVPNTNYWGGAAHIQQLIYYYIADGNTAFSKYQTGALDVINVPVADVTVVRGDANLSKQATLFPELTTFWMTYNAAEKPFDNPDVRMAFSKAIDRNALTNDVLHGTDKPIQEFFPKGMNGYDTSDNAQSFDPSAAKALLQKAGVTASQLNGFKLLTRNSSGSKTINQYIVQQWNTNLGLNIQLDVIDSKTVTQDIRKGKFDIYGPDGWGADYPDQQDWADIFTSGSCHSLNWGCVANNGGLKGYDDLVKKADTETNQSQRNADYAAAQKMLVDQAAVGFIYQQYEYDLISPKVSYTHTPFDDEYTPGDANYKSAFIKA
ncbi:MAG TPA: peptide ABC transporter substrate-binding protein [Candidatus Dormibacteraeota bacterium]|nr:peptide ABC transporter substrate-binding protein [Candidatus Dormibacteraeota bacterium]